MTEQLTLTAYDVKTREKNRPILNAKIKRTAKGAYMAQGNDEDGTKLTTLMNKEKAEAVVAAGLAQWSEQQ